jgi:polyisoprenoid-binding protein YceI
VRSLGCTPHRSLTATARACLLSVAACLIVAAPAQAAAVTYQIDPSHTYPSFEADHMGLSVWRGKFNRSSGNVTLDRESGSGQLEVRIEIDSIDFGLDAMNQVALGTDIFDAARFPVAVYSGRLDGFYANGIPSRVVGQLSLHGVTRPLTLDITQFRCAPHMMLRREVCGADALARFKRDDFGIDAGKAFGFDMTVTLRIQVEAIAVER